MGVVAALCVAVPASAAAAGTLDQQQTTVSIQVRIWSQLSVAQTFTAGLSGGLDQVDLYLGRKTDATEPVTVEIRDVSSGAPGTTVLVSAVLPAAAVPVSPTFVTVPFASPAPVLAGGQYAIVVYTADAAGYLVGFGDSDPYRAGGFFASPTSPPTTWQVPLVGFDVAFRTYVQLPNAAPDCSAVTATPGTLQPATRNQFNLITVSGATDAHGDTLGFHIDGVTQDEPVSGAGVGDDTAPDAALSADSNQVPVRAERNPMGNGRVYRIPYTVSDGRGGSCTGLAKVAVLRKKGQPAIDDGDTASWDSFTGAPL